MPIEPNPKETQSEFVSRCIAEEMKKGYEQSQSIAICYSKWRKKDKKKQNK